MSQAKILNTKNHQSHSLLDTEQVGRLIAADIVMPACFYLEGDLGSGKTTLCKTIIQSLGYAGVVTSPTYNLIQEYPVNDGIVYHMDLYRLQSPEELEFLAIADLYNRNSLFLIEWSDKGQGLLPEPTHFIRFESNLESNLSRNISVVDF